MITLALFSFLQRRIAQFISSNSSNFTSNNLRNNNLAFRFQHDLRF